MSEHLTPRWAAKHDLYRTAQYPDFGDLLRVVTAYYELYYRAAEFVAPYVSRQASSHLPFMPPEKDELRSAIGKVRPQLSARAHSAFLEAVCAHIAKSKGRRTMITPNPTTHHSAQFPSGTFNLKKVVDKTDIQLHRRQALGELHELTVFGGDAPVYIEGLKLPTETIQFIIVRPKLGKLGTASVDRWEALFYRQSLGYLVDHVDSDLNPRYSGKL
jgi:hypothetical protein